MPYFTVYMRQRKPLICEADSLMDLAVRIPNLIGFEEKCNSVCLGETMQTKMGSNAPLLNQNCFVVVTKTKRIDVCACWPEFNFVGTEPI